MDPLLSSISDLDAAFDEGITLPIAWRKEQLRQLWHLIADNQEQFIEAIAQDIGKPAVLVQGLEIHCVANEIVQFVDHMEEWLKDEPVDTVPPFDQMSPIIRRFPKGTCLVLGTWNYPLILTLLPFIGVIACGNTGVLRPSEHAPHIGQLLAKLFPLYLDQRCFRVVLGDQEVVKSLLTRPWGHILFTGSAAVGQQIMAEAAKFLTPVTLELGGRNAVVVTDHANVDLAAKRAIWGKVATAGQTCFAPNIALVHERVYDQFIEACCQTCDLFYKDGGPRTELVGRLRNLTDFKRVEHLLSSTKGSIVWGGKSTESTLFVEPTVVKDVPEANDPLIDSELFAPILPVIRYRDTLHAKALLRRLSPDPLAFYVFSEDLDEANALVNAARSGTAAINDVLAQIAPTNLPFGGVGRSGFGTYRGKASIDTFSQKQSIVTMATVPEAEQMLDWRYPYNESPETVIAVRSAMLAKLD